MKAPAPKRTGAFWRSGPAAVRAAALGRHSRHPCPASRCTRPGLGLPVIREDRPRSRRSAEGRVDANRRVVKDVPLLRVVPDGTGTQSVQVSAHHVDVRRAVVCRQGVADEGRAGAGGSFADADRPCRPVGTRFGVGWQRRLRIVATRQDRPGNCSGTWFGYDDQRHCNIVTQSARLRPRKQMVGRESRAWARAVGPSWSRYRWAWSQGDETGREQHEGRPSRSGSRPHAPVPRG